LLDASDLIGEMPGQQWAEVPKGSVNKS